MAAARRADLASISGSIVCGGIGCSVDVRKPSGIGNLGAGAGLFDAVGGSHQIRVVLQRAFDQFAQRGIGEDLAPGLVAKRRAVRSAIAVDRSGTIDLGRARFRTEHTRIH